MLLRLHKIGKRRLPRLLGLAIGVILAVTPLVLFGQSGRLSPAQEAWLREVYLNRTNIYDQAAINASSWTNWFHLNSNGLYSVFSQTNFWNTVGPVSNTASTALGTANTALSTATWASNQIVAAGSFTLSNVLTTGNNAYWQNAYGFGTLYSSNLVASNSITLLTNYLQDVCFVNLDFTGSPSDLFYLKTVTGSFQYNPTIYSYTNLVIGNTNYNSYEWSTYSVANPQWAKIAGPFGKAVNRFKVLPSWNGSHIYARGFKIEGSLDDATYSVLYSNDLPDAAGFTTLTLNNVTNYLYYKFTLFGTTWNGETYNRMVAIQGYSVLTGAVYSVLTVPAGTPPLNLSTSLWNTVGSVSNSTLSLSNQVGSISNQVLSISNQVGSLSNQVGSISNQVISISNQVSSLNTSLWNTVAGVSNNASVSSNWISSHQTNIAYLNSNDVFSANVSFSNEVVVGCTNLDTSGPYSIMPNGVLVTGPTNTDKGYWFGHSGQTNWGLMTYRSELDRFLYLYNFDSELPIMVWSRTGRAGLNHPPNIMDYHALWSGSLLDDVNFTGTNTADQTYRALVYIVATGTPDTWNWKLSADNGNTYFMTGTVANCATTNMPLTNGVSIFFGNTTGHSTGDNWKHNLWAQLPTATEEIRPRRFQEVLLGTNMYAGATDMWTDVSYDAGAGLVGGANVHDVLINTNQYIALGSKSIVNSIGINVLSPASGLTLVTEYYDGSAWVTMSNAANTYIDGTTNLSGMGQIQYEKNSTTQSKFTWPTESADRYNLYWYRLHTSTTPSGPTTIGAITPQGTRRLEVYSSQLSVIPEFYTDIKGNNYGTRFFQMDTNTSFSHNQLITADGALMLIHQANGTFYYTTPNHFGTTPEYLASTAPNATAFSFTNAVAANATTYGNIIVITNEYSTTNYNAGQQFTFQVDMAAYGVGTFASWQGFQVCEFNTNMTNVVATSGSNSVPNQISPTTLVPLTITLATNIYKKGTNYLGMRSVLYTGPKAGTWVRNYGNGYNSYMIVGASSGGGGSTSTNGLASLTYVDNLSNAVFSAKMASATNSDYATYANTASNLVAGYKPASSTNSDYATWANTASNLVAGWKIQSATNADYATTANVSSNVTSLASNAIAGIFFPSNNVWTGTSNTFTNVVYVGNKLHTPAIAVNTNTLNYGVLDVQGISAFGGDLDIYSPGSRLWFLDRTDKSALPLGSANGHSLFWKSATQMWMTTYVNLLGEATNFFFNLDTAGGIQDNIHPRFGIGVLPTESLDVKDNGRVRGKLAVQKTSGLSNALDVVGSDTLYGQANISARFRAVDSDGATGAGVVIGSQNGNAPFISDCGGPANSQGLFLRGNGNTGIKIDTNGNPELYNTLTFGGESRTNWLPFACSVGNTSGPAISQNTFFPVPMDCTNNSSTGPVYDPQHLWVTRTNAVLPTSGWWRVDCGLEIQRSSGGAVTRVLASICTNALGTEVARKDVNIAASVAFYHFDFSRMFYVNSTASVFITVYPVNDTGWTVYGRSDQTWCNIEYLGH